MRKVLFAAVAAALLLGVVPAGATHGGTHPEFVQSRVYFKCAGDAPAQNLDAPVTWNATPPAASVQSGAGCGFVDPGAPLAEVTEGFDPVYAGDVVGNVRNMTVELYVFPHSNWTPVWGTAWIGIDLVIDGKQVLTADEAHEVDIEETNSGATQRVTFSITGLDGSWVPHEDGPGAAVHEVELTVTNLDETEVGVWAWDTTEVPAGITFNDPGAGFHYTIEA